MKEITGNLHFAKEEALMIYMDFNDLELKAFKKDLHDATKKVTETIAENPTRICKVNATQRFYGRHFIVNIIFDFRDTENAIILFQELKEVTLDEYLDEYNRQSKDKSYIKMS